MSGSPPASPPTPIGSASSSPPCSTATTPHRPWQPSPTSSRVTSTASRPTSATSSTHSFSWAPTRAPWPSRPSSVRNASVHPGGPTPWSSRASPDCGPARRPRGRSSSTSARTARCTGRGCPPIRTPSTTPSPAPSHRELVESALTGDVDLPRLVLIGDVDPLADREALIAAVGRLSRARLTVVRGAHHDVLNDLQHRSVAAEVVTFLEVLRNELEPVLAVESSAW